MLLYQKYKRSKCESDAGLVGNAGDTFVFFAIFILIYYVITLLLSCFGQNVTATVNKSSTISTAISVPMGTNVSTLTTVTIACLHTASSVLRMQTQWRLYGHGEDHTDSDKASDHTSFSSNQSQNT